MEIEAALESLGLTKQESRVYVASLKLGIAKASAIAQKSGIQRGAAYYILKLLKEKGFIVEVIKSGVQYYRATSPSRLQGLITEEQERKREIVVSILPELKSLESSNIQAPHIELYEGYEGFKTIFARLLEKSNKEFLCFLSSKSLEFLPHFHEQFRMKRTAKKIRIRTITEDTPALREIRKLDKKELRQTRFHSIILEGNDVLEYILEDAIVVIRASKNEQIGMYICDRSLANLHRKLFEELWKIAK